MKVSELITWLEKFENQDAIVEVVDYCNGRGYYEPVGIDAKGVSFEPDVHVVYKDDGDSYPTLLLGVING